MTTKFIIEDRVIERAMAQYPKAPELIENNGGAERDRTADLLNAIQALSQLSYSPVPRFARKGAREGGGI